MKPSQQERKAWYDRLSPWYDLISGSWEKAARQEALQMLAPQQGEILLEIGSGTGHGLAFLAQATGPSGRVFGLDLSTGMLAKASNRLHANKKASVLLVAGDAASLPFHHASFDAIFASFVIELFDEEEIPTLLKCCREALRPSGRLCAVSLTKSGHSLLLRRLYEWARSRFPKMIDCRPIFLTRALEDADFKIQEVSHRFTLDLPVEIVLAVKSEAVRLSTYKS
jgi:ubiquinone/menaquinone biosynthesis C-methylase UbiE